MSKVASLTDLSDPKYRQTQAAAKRVQAAKTIQASSVKVEASIKKAEATLNKVYASFESSKDLTAARIMDTHRGLQAMHKALSALYRKASVNLGKTIAMDLPTPRMLGQMEGLAMLKHKSAALMMQARASLAADESEIDETLIPVDEQGYVAPATPETDLPDAGTIDQEDQDQVAASMQAALDPAGEGSPPTDNGDLTRPNIAAGEGEEIPDGDAGIDMDDLELGGDAMAAIAGELCEDLPVGNYEDGHNPTAAATAGRTATARARSAVPRAATASAAQSDDALMQSIVADFLRP